MLVFFVQILVFSFFGQMSIFGFVLSITLIRKLNERAYQKRNAGHSVSDVG